MARAHLVFCNMTTASGKVCTFRALRRASGDSYLRDVQLCVTPYIVLWWHLKDVNCCFNWGQRCGRAYYHKQATSDNLISRIVLL